MDEIIIKNKIKGFLCKKNIKFWKMKNTNKQKFILIDTPVHGNLGDQAIVEAELKFLRENFVNIPLFEITQEEYICLNTKIHKFINEQDIILIQGGGFIGTIWLNEEIILEKILLDFKNNPIIIFPQTIYFKNDNNGNKQLKKFNTVLSNIKNIHIFVRDRNSYKFALNNLNIPIEKFSLVPDMVSYLSGWKFSDKQNIAIFCLRKDKEKVLDDFFIEHLKQDLSNKGLKIITTDTCVNKKIIIPITRKKLIYNKLYEFSKAHIVITDRMHGMMFSVITGTPCIAFDNISKKVSGACKWFEYIKYLKYIPNKTIPDNTIESLLSNNKNNYNNDKLNNYYKLIKQAIESQLI